MLCVASTLLELVWGDAWQRRVLRIVVAQPVLMVLGRVHTRESRNGVKGVSKKSIRSGFR